MILIGLNKLKHQNKNPRKLIYSKSNQFSKTQRKKNKTILRTEKFKLYPKIVQDTVLRKRINLKQVGINWKDFKRSNHLDKIRTQIEVKRIIQEATKKVSKTKTVHIKKVYMNKSKPCNNKAMEF